MASDGATGVGALALTWIPFSTASLSVPSPNVAEDHQTKNAKALVDKGAAMMVSDAEATDCGISTALKMVGDEALLAKLSQNIAKLATPDAAERVADEIVKLVK